MHPQLPRILHWFSLSLTRILCVSYVLHLCTCLQAKYRFSSSHFIDQIISWHCLTCHQCRSDNTQQALTFVFQMLPSSQGIDALIKVSGEVPGVLAALSGQYVKCHACKGSSTRQNTTSNMVMLRPQIPGRILHPSQHCCVLRWLH